MNLRLYLCANRCGGCRWMSSCLGSASGHGGPVRALAFQPTEERHFRQFRHSATDGRLCDRLAEQVFAFILTQ